MRLLLGNHLIETDYIESVEKLAPYSVKIYFISGHQLTVTCGVKSTGSAFWPEDANKLMTRLANTDTPAKRKKR